MENEIYLKVAEVLSSTAPSGCQKIIMDVELSKSGDVAKFDFGYSLGGEFKQYDPAAKTSHDLRELLCDLREVMSKGGAESWGGCKVFLDFPSDKLKIDFRYGDSEFFGGL